MHPPSGLPVNADLEWDLITVFSQSAVVIGLKVNTPPLNEPGQLNWCNVGIGHGKKHAMRLSVGFTVRVSLYPKEPWIRINPGSAHFEPLPLQDGFQKAHSERDSLMHPSFVMVGSY